ncbi:hypothetical protein GCM10009850_043410 [Nonomuraea monospora]|uniref:Uncharacterized protein n=1 Tax=Nonomuraea monospora TaxID=568818 RepID=A0ABP5PEA7_9ACTN
MLSAPPEGQAQYLVVAGTLGGLAGAAGLVAAGEPGLAVLFYSWRASTGARGGV